jgi:hypothetical protein
MKINRTICDLCNNDREATRTLKFFSLEGKITRGAPKARSQYDLCDYCHGEIVVFFDSLQRTADQ